MTSRRVGAVLLFPGAGSSADHPALVAIEESLGAGRAKRHVVRADFPYRRAGRRAPDRAPVLVDCVRAEAASLAASVRPRKLVLGGRSMGGRMCSIAVAGPGPGAVDDQPALAAAGLVLISYPLHPPGKPDRLRVEHLDRLHVPCLFVHGTRDPFANPEELLEWTARIPGPVTHEWVEGGRHDLRGADHDVASRVAAWVRSLG